MPTRDDKDITGFTRDPNLTSTLGDEFTGGTARAEQLISAVQFRETEALIAANLIPAEPLSEEDAEKWTKEKVGSAADLPAESIRAISKRGDYLVYVFEGPDGRTGKDALRIDGDSLEADEEADTPEKAAIRASVLGAQEISRAKSEAERIIEQAREKARELVQKAAEEADETRAKLAERAAKRQQEGDGEKPE